MSRPRKISVHCVDCGTPLPVEWLDAFGFDCEWLLCKQCQPEVKQPKVTLYGAPDGQEMGRWSE